MAGRGPAPKDPSLRVRRNKVSDRGQPVEASGAGWQHGPVPDPPEGLMPASVSAWVTWMGAWFAAFWSPADLPGLRQLVRLYDQVERGEYQRAGELRLQMDTYGVTPKGQQDRRWRASQAEASQAAESAGAKSRSGRYGHLQSVV